MFVQDQPPAQIQQKKTVPKKPTHLHQESRGNNSPNIFAGNNSTIIVSAHDPRLPVYAGTLTPDSIPVNRSAAIPPEALILKLGDELRVVSLSSGQNVFSYHGSEFLKVGIEGQRMWITTTINDEAGQYIVRVIENEFQSSNERAFNPRMPDPHTLIVRDEHGAEVLNLHFLNPKAIRLTGRFRLPDSRVIIIDPQQGIRFPGGGGINRFTVMVPGGPRSGFINFQ